MISLTSLMIKDYLKEWYIAWELTVCLFFLYFFRYIDNLGDLIRSLAFLSVVLTTITTFRLARKSWSPKGYYLIISGPGKNGYILSQFMAAAIIDIMLSIGTLILSLFITGVFARSLESMEFMMVFFIGLFSIILVTGSICILFSKLIMPRWGFLVALAILLALTFGGSSNIWDPVFGDLIAKINIYGPPIKLTIDKLSSGRFAGLEALLAKSLIYCISVLIASVLFFRNKELIFEER